MARVWGMDEAGYGPNLGPLVVALTCWEVPDVAFDFWSKLGGSCSREGTQNRTRLHIADSKVVHNSADGIAPLELSAWTLLQQAQYLSNDIRAMVSNGHDLPALKPVNESGVQHCFEYSLPVEADGTLVSVLSAQLGADLDCSQVKCLGIWADIIWPAHFNELVGVHGNKSNVLTYLSLNLLASRWSTDDAFPQLVLADRHGGRKFYAGPLQGIVGESGFITVLSETKERSRYRIQTTEIEFAEKSERHFAVATASIVAKYLRELAMLEFNAFWSHHQGDLKPTKGYPEDARRFLADIQQTIDRLQIPMSTIWRER